MRASNRKTATRWPLVAAALLVACGLTVALATVSLAEQSSDDNAGESVQVATEVPATGNDLRSPRAHNSPELAVDPTNERVVALANRLDAPDFSCALQVSGDGGGHWGPVEPVPELPDQAEKCYAPELAFDADGTLYYLFVGLAGRGNRPVGVYLTSSEDRGATFSEPRKVLGEGNYQVRMALDRSAGEQGRIHLVWLQATGEPTLGGLPAPPNPIVAAHSDDGGETFTDPVQISDPDEHLRVVAPAVALGADGAVHVAYYDLQDDARDYQGLEGDVWPGNWSVVHSVSHDGGETFEEEVVVDGQLVPPERVMLIFTMPPPALAADDNGNVYTAWHDARNGDWDVFAAASRDQGATWGQPVRVNDDERGNGKHQLLPQLGVAPDGRLDAVFFDRRDAENNIAQHVFYAASTDHGQRFSENRRLTRFPSSSRVGAQYAVTSALGKFDLGLRLGLVAGETRSLAAWPDTRHALRGTAQQEVFTARILREAPAEGETAAVGWPLPVAGGLLLVGVAVLARVWRGRRSGITPQPEPAGES